MTKLGKMLLLAFIVATLAAAGTSAGSRAPKKTVQPVAANKPPAAEPTIVEVSSFKFEPKLLTVKKGTTVRWINKSGWHTITADNGSFKSTELKSENAYFDHKFTKSGKFPYYCTFHGHKGGKDMAGTIIVEK